MSNTTFAGKFADPNAVAGYLPYNISLLNGDLFVAYAQPSGIVTTGGGYIDEFDTSGNFISRIYTDTAGTNLKGPWGMAIAPAGFGGLGGALLVGSFGNATATSGNGTISIISLASTPGTLVGTLTSPNGAISNAGLWSLLDSATAAREAPPGHAVLHRRTRRPDRGPSRSDRVLTQWHGDCRRADSLRHPADGLHDRRPGLLRPGCLIHQHQPYVHCQRIQLCFD